MKTNTTAYDKIDVSGMTVRQVGELAFDLGRPIHFEATPRKDWNDQLQILMLWGE